MSEKQWSVVDGYLSDTLLPADEVMEAALKANGAGGLPAIDVAPNQGKFLNLLARLCGARRILEMGTLGGYSTIWLARALPDGGRLVTLEFEQKHADVARSNIAHAGFAEVVEIRVGAAVDSLARLVEEDVAPFDMIFIDADKPNYPHYLQGALKLSRVGTLIVLDNVVRDGDVANADSRDDRTQGVRRCLEMMAAEPRLEATALQTVGSKGWDGFAMAMVVGE